MHLLDINVEEEEEDHRVKFSFSSFMIQDD
jgi:hypothetical protein